MRSGILCDIILWYFFKHSRRTKENAHEWKEIRTPAKFLQILMRNEFNTHFSLYMLLVFFSFHSLCLTWFYIVDISIYANVHSHQTSTCCVRVFCFSFVSFCFFLSFLSHFDVKRILSSLSWSSLAGIWLFICITWKISNHTIHLNPI